MKKVSLNILKSICILLLLNLSAQAQTYQLVWADEFNGSIGPDWVFETGTGSGGWGNNELEYYRRENASIVNNALQIQAKNESFGGMNYTSARMKTQGKKSWTYGKIEARLSMPSFQGIWPAFWALGDNIASVGWPACGEIDIMEHVNGGNTTYGTIHWADQNNVYAQYGGNTTTTVTSMHTYAIEWTPSSIKWTVDGVQFLEANIANSINGTNEFHNNFFILFNLAVGGNWPGFVIDNNGFPANLTVDYVRVYQLGTTQPPTTGVATFYKDCNFGGTAVGLNVGTYTLSQLTAAGILNDDISSVKVSAGYKVTLYMDDNFTGTSKVLTADLACDGTFNDKTSSLKIETNTAAFSLTVQAESYSSMLGVQLENTTDAGGGQNVGWIDNSDWMAYNSIAIPTTGTYLVEYRVASPNSTGVVSMDLNAGATQLGTLAVPNTGGWQTWTTISRTVTINAGTYNFGIFASTGGWNLNWWRISKTAGARMVSNELIASSELFSAASYPNPTVNNTKIKVNLPVAGHTNVSVYNATGNKTSELHNGNLSAGLHEFDFNTENLPTGVYIYSVTQKGKKITGKILKK